MAKKTDDIFMSLRKKAEKLLEQTEKKDRRGDFEDMEKLFEELHIYQIELEMQQQELQRINEHLTKEQQKYRSLYMEAPVAYFTLNETGNILELNQAAADMLDIPLQAFKYTSLFPYLEEASRIEFTRYFKRVFDSGSVEFGDLTFLNSRREPVSAHLWASVYFDPDLQERVVRCAVTDLTKLKEYEKEIEYRKRVANAIARYETIFAVTSVGIGITDQEGRIVECNAAFTDMLGYDRDELYGRRIQEFNHPEDVLREEETILGLSEQNSRTRLEKRFLKKDGGILWADLTVSAVFPRDMPVYYVGILTDITEGINSRSTINQLNDHLEAALQSGNMAWWEFELPSGRVIFNERKATMLGYKPEKFTHYTDFMNLVHPDDYNPTMEAFRRHLDGSAETYSCEYRIRSAAGEYLWFRDLGKITSREGGVITLTGIVSEITDVKRTREAMERFRAAMDNSSDQVFLIDRDSMKFIDVNDTACTALEYTREELLSLGPQDIKPDYTLQTLADELDEILKEPAGTGVIETVHRSKTGTLIPVEVRLRTFQTPGNAYVIGVARDMTEHRRVKDELEAVNRRFLTILQHINVGILVIARHSREILYVNPYLQSFYPDPLEHKLCSEVFGYKDDLCPRCPVFFDTEEAEKAKHQFVTSEYHLPEIEKHFLMQISPIRWVDKHEAALLILTDITSLKEVEQLKDDIGRITRHDLKNPLNGILGGVQLLLLDGEDKLTEEQTGYIRMIETSGKRMLTMIDESLGLYKMEKGLYEVRSEPVDLDGLLKSILEEHRRLIGELGIDVNLERTSSSEGSDGSFTARGEQLLCYSIFSNIIGNALDASKKKDSIKISLGEDEDRRVYVSVWNREAIPGEIRGNFGRKYSTWGKTRGTGLGVYSARLMTETQGGVFSWESSESAGTTVKIDLPAAT